VSSTGHRALPPMEQFDSRNEQIARYFVQIGRFEVTAPLITITVIRSTK
jgi:hypothetical protein